MQDTNHGKKLNWLRAAVLGANDGIVSVASIIVGVAGAANTTRFILTAGVAGMVAGALSMATGEYVSVSTQRDTEKVFLANGNTEINPDHLTNPWHAAYASALAFFSGAIIPIMAMLLAPVKIRIPIVFISVIFALAITGTLSAGVGGANKKRAAIRVVIGGLLAMIVTFGIGKLFR